MRKKSFIVAGLLLLSLAGVWRFALVPRLTERIPEGWQWEANSIGYETYPDAKTGQLPDRDAAGTYSHAISIVANSRQPASVELDDKYLIHDIASGQVTFAYNYRALVDPRTGTHLSAEYRGDYFLFLAMSSRKLITCAFPISEAFPSSSSGKKRSRVWPLTFSLITDAASSLMLTPGTRNFLVSR